MVGCFKCLAIMNNALWTFYMSGACPHPFLYSGITWLQNVHIFAFNRYATLSCESIYHAQLQCRVVLIVQHSHQQLTDNFYLGILVVVLSFWIFKRIESILLVICFPFFAFVSTCCSLTQFLIGYLSVPHLFVEGIYLFAIWAYFLAGVF